MTSLAMAQNRYEQFDVPQPPRYQINVSDTTVSTENHEQPVQKRFRYLALVLNGLSLLSGVIGTAIPFWAYESTTYGITISQGLWAACGLLENTGWTCETVGAVPSWMAAVRAMEITGLLLIAAAGGCGLLKIFVVKDKKIFPRVVAILAAIAGVLMFFGAVIFSIEISDASPMAVLYFGFGLCLLAGMLGVVTGIVYVIADRRKEL